MLTKKKSKDVNYTFKASSHIHPFCCLLCTFSTFFLRKVFYPNIELNSLESSFRVSDEFFGLIALLVIDCWLFPHEHVGEKSREDENGSEPLPI